MPAFLLSILTSKTGIISIIIFLLFSTLGGYYYWSQRELKVLKNNNSIIRVELDKQYKVIENLEKDILLARKEHKEYGEKLSAMSEKNKKLQLLLSSKKEFVLSEQINTEEKLHNKIVENSNLILRCFEVVTGDKVSRNEKNIDCPVVTIN